MAMKKTLLQIVQEILNDMDAEQVNSISDSVEAQQIASIVESTFYNIIATRNIPEHQELLKPTALGDNNYPTHFELGDNLRQLDKLWYDNSDDSSFEYATIKWKDPVTFLKHSDALTSNYDSIVDKNGTTRIRIQNNKKPEHYTTFDDYYIILDSYNSSLESTLQESKIRAVGVVYPVFDATSDSYQPDLDAVFFPYLINESKSVAFSVLKGGPDPKIEQAAKRQKSYIQNNRHRTQQNVAWSVYGR
jgi:hypothetical protein